MYFRTARSLIFIAAVLFYIPAIGQQLSIQQMKGLDSVWAINHSGLVNIHNKQTTMVGPHIQRNINPLPAIGPSLEPPRRVSASCHDTSSKFYIELDSIRFFPGTPFLSHDGHLLIPGSATNKTSSSSRAFLMKCDEDGNILWTKLYDSAGTRSAAFGLGYSNVLELMDGSILLAGRTSGYNGNSDVALTRTDNTGNIIWHRVFNSVLWIPGSGSGDFFPIAQLKQDPTSGDLYLSAGHWYQGQSLTRLNIGTGTIIWSKTYPAAGQSTGDRTFGIDILPNEIRSFGRSLTTDGAVNIGIYRIDKNSGDTIQTKAFTSQDPAGTRVDILGVEPLQVLDNGHYIVSGSDFGYFHLGSNDTTSLYQASTVEFDHDLNFVRAYCFRNNIEANTALTSISTFHDGSGLFSMYHNLSTYTGDMFFVQYKDGNIFKERKQYYGETYNNGNQALRLFSGADMILGRIINMSTDEDRMQFMKLHASDTASSCLGIDDVETFIQLVKFIPARPGLGATGSRDLQENQMHTIVATELLPARIPGCTQVSHCDSLQLFVPKTSICLGDSIQVITRKNAGCGSLVPLTFDADPISSVRQINDSTTVFRFRASCSGYIYGTVQGCTPVKDSVFVQVLQSPASLDLGPDTTLCPGNTIVLHAKPGYASYLWPDGTTDSVFTVTQPGIYYATTTDACGGIFHDTVAISAHPPVSISIGPDRSKCNADTVQLTAPSGFLNYAWSPSDHISSTTAQSVIVNPIGDAVYTIRAEKTPGCFAYDTVSITVHHSPGINLGNDTSFCMGQSIVLDAGSGFSAYQWSTGAVNQHLTVAAAGIFSITATTPDQCISTDTLRVLNVFPLPVPVLDHDAELCTNATRTLDPGTFDHYSWQDGSIGRTFSVSGVGTYYVMVTDAHGCQGSDTAVIQTLLPLPANFLPQDTMICSYGTLQLQSSQDFSYYLWSNGAATRSLTITAPGTYSLYVRDNKNCTGRDSVTVSLKECLEGLYVPSAFTPNNDGRNDVFRALLFGSADYYLFTVYDRWGRIVFQTTDPRKGWNGTVSGKPQDTGAFVWTCTYQLTGQQKKLERGTVILIR